MLADIDGPVHVSILLAVWVIGVNAPNILHHCLVTSNFAFLPQPKETVSVGAKVLYNSVDLDAVRTLP